VRALPGKEEYADSEKYELRVWDFDVPGNIKSDIRFINALRRDHPALQQLSTLKFYNVWNDHILYYGKRTTDLADFLLFAVSLDPMGIQEAEFEVPLWEFGLPDDAEIAAFDHVTGHRFTWAGKVQKVRLTPDDRPYAVWSLLGSEPRTL
jgi:starch synthase (maltosyl-transferring)